MPQRGQRGSFTIMKNKETWKLIIQTVISILSAIATTLGLNSCLWAFERWVMSLWVLSNEQWVMSINHLWTYVLLYNKRRHYWVDGHPELVSGSVRGERQEKARGEMLKQVQHDIWIHLLFILSFWGSQFNTSVQSKISTLIVHHSSLTTHHSPLIAHHSPLYNIIMYIENRFRPSFAPYEAKKSWNSSFEIPPLDTNWKIKSPKRKVFNKKTVKLIKIR